MATNHSQPQPREEGPGTTSSPTGHGGQLRLEIEIEPDASTCPIATAIPRARSGEVQLVGDHCHVAFDAPAHGRGSRTVRSTIEESCPCMAVCESGVVPTDLSVEDGSLLVEAVVASRDTVTQLSTRLDGVEVTWSLRKLQRIPAGTDDPDRISLPDDVSVTEKQREIVQAAVEQGYYETPRQTSLGDLAEEFDVSRSALSQRLAAVESKLVERLAAHL